MSGQSPPRRREARSPRPHGLGLLALTGAAGQAPVPAGVALSGHAVQDEVSGLLALTKPLDVPMGDQADGKSEEGLVDVVASF